MVSFSARLLRAQFVAKQKGNLPMRRTSAWQFLKCSLSGRPAEQGSPTACSWTGAAIKFGHRLFASFCQGNLANASTPGAFLQFIRDKLSGLGRIILQLLAALLKRGSHEGKGVWFKFEHVVSK